MYRICCVLYLWKRNKMTNTKTTGKKAIEVKIWKGQQSINYTQIATMGSFKIRIDIKRDSYDMQSHATASVFSMEKLDWNKIYSIPYPEMKSLAASAYDNKPTELMFAADSLALFAGVKSILF